jgi:hypothetical protein
MKMMRVVVLLAHRILRSSDMRKIVAPAYSTCTHPETLVTTV